MSDADPAGPTPPTDAETRTAGVVPGNEPRLRPGPAPREAFGVGSLLASRYRIFGLASGGMGRVYLAEDLDVGRDGVALKVAIKTVADYDEWKAAYAADPVEE